MNNVVAEKKENVISISGLCKSFGDRLVLDHFSMDVHEGENLVVLGKSGSGKSVLIKCIIGLMRPDSGNLLVFNENISRMKPDALDRIRVQVGFLFQSNALYDSMSVRENLEFPLRRHGKDKTRKEITELVKEALENVGLLDAIDMMPAELSGGMKKRIALARTLILKPKIILYDEPTTGLDPVTGKEICHLIVEVQKKYNASSIIISHDINCVKITSNRVVVLIDGKCYTSGTFEKLSESGDPNISQFFY
ncbi:MAG: ATP-binding cassette domain-containing protein [Bacteroidetes bacterium]|nr:ATP-binding cassette domain-containing protein [Bacteroidota bacterium]